MKHEERIQRQEKILTLYEDGQVEKDPDVGKLSRYFEASPEVIRQELRELRRFMRSDMYEGDLAPIYDVKDASGRQVSSKGNGNTDWKKKLNAA